MAQPSSARESRELRALSYFAVAAVAVICWIAAPVSIGILLGTLMAFALQPVYERLVERTGRPRMAVAACAVFAAVAITGVISSVVSLLIARGVAMAQALFESLGPQGQTRLLIERLASRLSPELRGEWIARLQDAAAQVASRAAAVAGALAQALLGALLTIFFSVMTVSFILKNWTLITVRAENLLPLNRRHTRALFAEFRRVGRMTLLGTVVTGIAQGLFAAIGYLIFGLPEPAFFGALTAVASLLPAVGTALVWVPAGIFLIMTGHAGGGVMELVYGAVVVVGVSDYILRPWLVGGQGEMPALLIFASLFGGVEVFGLVGLILGPLMMSIALALLRIYAREKEANRDEGSSDRPVDQPLP